MGKEFDEIATEIPILKQLERICELVSMDQYNRLEHCWYEVIKPVVVNNVGFNSPYPDFSDSKSYDVVYEDLAKKLGL